MNVIVRQSGMRADSYVVSEVIQGRSYLTKYGGFTSYWEINFNEIHYKTMREAIGVLKKYKNVKTITKKKHLYEFEILSDRIRENSIPF